MTLIERIKNRRFNWKSSRQLSTTCQQDLNEQMRQYYSAWETRQDYQVMLDNSIGTQPAVLAAVTRPGALRVGHIRVTEA